MISPVEIVGAGPAGLAAAVTIAAAGGKASVFEANDEVGSRFHGDFQGLENWSTDSDVLEELATLGIDAGFAFRAFRECLFFDAAGRDYPVRADNPLFYLVRRGSQPGSLDMALKQQTLEAGVKLHFDSPRSHLPAGGIVAHGPRRADAIATGYLFETDAADGAYAAVSDRLAPAGYAYLLIWGGRGTVAACQFVDFHNSTTYLEQTIDFFREKAGLKMTNPRPFGGFGNLYTGQTVRKGRLLYAGEAAGFQDALFGFGLRYAMLSGHLAARAWLSGNPERYDLLCQQRFYRQLKLATVNRFFYAGFGDRGYARLLRTLQAASSPRDWLQRFYTSGRARLLAYPLAQRKLRNKAELVAGFKEGCDCTWCRCQHALQKGKGSDQECGFKG